MIRKIAWETFKNTGDIHTYLELKQIEDIEDKIEKNDGNILNENIQEKFENKENFEAKEEL